jgi:hypothetical protein
MSDDFPRRDGCLRRLIDLRREDAHTAIGWLEDDFHHFGVTIVHDDGGLITDVSASAPRFPYTTCPGAAIALKGMIGHKLSSRATDIGTMISMRENCTHMFDLGGLTMALAASTTVHRRYEAIVSDREIVAWEGGRRILGVGTAMLRLDQELVLSWVIDRRIILGPDEWAGQSLGEGFRQRTETMPLAAAEHATILRRAIMVAVGRSSDPDRHPTAAGRGKAAVCHTFLERNRDVAERVTGSTRNFAASDRGMLGKVRDKP